MRRARECRCGCTPTPCPPPVRDREGPSRAEFWAGFGQVLAGFMGRLAAPSVGYGRRRLLVRRRGSPRCRPRPELSRAGGRLPALITARKPATSSAGGASSSGQPPDTEDSHASMFGTFPLWGTSSSLEQDLLQNFSIFFSLVACPFFFFFLLPHNANVYPHFPPGQADGVTARGG